MINLKRSPSHPSPNPYLGKKLHFEEAVFPLCASPFALTRNI